MKIGLDDWDYSNRFEKYKMKQCFIEYEQRYKMEKAQEI